MLSIFVYLGYILYDFFFFLCISSIFFKDFFGFEEQRTV